MRRLRAFLVRVGSALRPARGDDEFAAELESHLQMHVDDFVRAGIDPAEARRRAVLALGGIASTFERQRDRRRLPIVDGLRQDIVYALRTLRRAPGFSAVTIATLAIGIGANTAIFSAVRAVLLKPLPFAQPDRLVMIYGSDRGDDRHDVVSYPTFVDWRDQSRSFTAAAAFANRSVSIDGDAATSLAGAKQVSASFFDVLGVRPARGRSFTSADGADGAAGVVLLSDGFWRQQFGGTTDAVGQTLRIGGEVYTIVGVMPPGFRFEPGAREDLYVPLRPDPNRRHGFLRIVARLRPRVSRAQAQADVDQVAARLTRIYPRTESPASKVVPLIDALAGPGRTALLVLFGIVTLLLLISCANVAGLLLARGAARRHELAVRAALGAGRGRIVRQLLTESLVLATAGGAAGVALADGLARLLVAIVASSFSIPRLETTHTDGAVVAFTAIVSIATGVAYGIVPAWSSAASDLSGSLREAAHTTSAARSPRVGRALVVVQLALALVMLAAAGVLVRTLVTMLSTRPGFDTRDMIAVDVWLPPQRFARREDRARFFDESLARIRALRGVRSAAFVADLPLGGGIDTQSFHIVNRPDPAPGRAFNAGFNVASAGYFATMGIPIREGRGFLAADAGTAPGVAIVNEAASRRFWPDTSPIGAHILLPLAGGRAADLRIVGVAGDVRHRSLAQPPRPEIFLNALQSELPWFEAALVARIGGDSAVMADPITAALRAADANVPITRVRTMDDVIAQQFATPRLYSLLLGSFAAAALALAAVGLYGLIAYTVAQRVREIGVRLALGASPTSVLRLVLGQALRLAAIGSITGILGGIAATRVLVGVTGGVEPNDPSTFAAVVGILLAVAALAAYVPARRAAAVDPIVALRVE